ncbi:nucleic-acid-binding protein from transposon X-element [Caerostris extrusa]|uniref:Nucleic-acid-binding protein from transposon X-element n=1 Tax=Caerostris extrusa TaxID=172846 RepID=A0AAV4NNY5_CAEEX|nr:nucleic-acid-binding protein from transposon X-element [Caerostris extrusa]
MLSLSKISKSLMFFNSKRGTGEIPMSLFHIQLETTDNSEKIWTIESLPYTKIKVEKYNSSGGIGQCHRCQLFVHSSINCHLPARCVKYAGPHLTSECGHTTKMDNPVCANCTGSHPASYRGCPKFSKPVATFNKTKTFTSTYTNPNISYAFMLTSP